MKISKRAEYGLMAMIFLAKNPISKFGRGIFSLRDISAETKTSFVFLEKIFAKLEKAGLVRGTKGMRGGYVLAKRPKEINAKDIVSLLTEAPMKLLIVPVALKKGKCSAKTVWAQVEKALSKTLESISLADLIR